MSYRRILCAVDFSDQSNAAFYRAVELADRYSASLMVLHALEVQPLVSRWIDPEGLSHLTVEIENRAQEALDSLLGTVSGLAEKLKVRTLITSGRASTEILENARVWNADLVVLGSRGGGSLEDAVLGTTVDRVVSGVQCSVLVVRN